MSSQIQLWQNMTEIPMSIITLISPTDHMALADIYNHLALLPIWCFFRPQQELQQVVAFFFSGGVTHTFLPTRSIVCRILSG